MDESRKQFEEWCESFHGNPPLGGWDSSRCGDVYYTHHIDVLWQAWQASRAAIEIELPKKTERMEFDTDFDDGSRWGRNDAISDCAGIIRAAGIKVKE